MKNLLKLNFLLSATVVIMLLTSFSNPSPKYPPDGEPGIPHVPIGFSGVIYLANTVYCNWLYSFVFPGSGVCYVSCYMCPGELCFKAELVTCDYPYRVHPVIPGTDPPEYSGHNQWFPE